MILTKIKVNVVRNENEYIKLVNEDYRKKYPYEESKPSLPWLVISFDKVLGDNLTSECIMEMKPTADFSGISTAPNGEWQKGSSNSQLKLNLDKIQNSLMLELKKDCGFDNLANNLEVVIKDNNGKEFKDALNIIDFSQKETILRNIEEKCFQQGENYAAELIYELIQQGKI